MDYVQLIYSKNSTFTIKGIIRKKDEIKDGKIHKNMSQHKN